MAKCFCAVCEKEFFAQNNRALICSSDCKKKRDSFLHKNKHVEKICKYCNNKYEGTRTSKICRVCRDNGIKRQFDIIETSVLCRVCKEEIRKESKKNTKVSPIKIGETCNKCKEINREKLSDRMKIKNPMFVPEYRIKSVEKKYNCKKDIDSYKQIKKKYTRFSKEEFSKFASDRIKGERNPMKKDDIKKKAAETRRKKYDSGEIKKVFGKNHWSWKGNRERSKTIRSRLYSFWIRPILERDNFTCCFCNQKGGCLEVHHIEPSFENIVLKVTDGKSLNDYSDEEFEIVCDNVIKEHKNCLGITCCQNCHKKIDKRRH